MDAKSSLAGRRIGAHGVALLAWADDVQASLAVRHFSPFKTSWTSSGVRVISIRRFSAFPSGAALLETGRKAPYPTAARVLPSTAAFSSRNRTTAVARSAARSQLVRDC